MKFTNSIALLGLAAGGLKGAVAGPPGAGGSGFETCSDQHDCIVITSVEESSSECSGDCQYKICVELDFAKAGCGKSGSISHICLAENSQDPDVCNPGNYAEINSGSAPTLNSGVDSRQCQTVDAGSSALFILKDGGGCENGSAQSFGEDSASCAPTTERYCTGNGNVGKECAWTITAPSSCTATPTPPTPTPPTPTPPTPTPPTPTPPTPTPPTPTPPTPTPPTPTPPTPTPPTPTPPTPTPPTPTPPGPSPGANGDPHIRTWTGETFDFHGVCDLVLLENKAFEQGLGLDLHIRTKDIQKQWSYISNAVLQIGEDTLEVAAGRDGSKGDYWINGVRGEDIWEDEEILAAGLSGFPITYRRANSRSAEFEVGLGNGEKIVLRTWAKFVHVAMKVEKSRFEGSRGLMGTLEGVKLARDDATVVEDLNEFGQEWQVKDHEGKLFHNAEGPQFPETCILPLAADMRRRLRDSLITQEEAEIACSRVSEADRDLCIFDVMATSDTFVAGAY